MTLEEAKRIDAEYLAAIEGLGPMEILEFERTPEMREAEEIVHQDNLSRRTPEGVWGNDERQS